MGGNEIYWIFWGKGEDCGVYSRCVLGVFNGDI